MPGRWQVTFTRATRTTARGIATLEIEPQPDRAEEQAEEILDEFYDLERWQRDTLRTSFPPLSRTFGQGAISEVAMLSRALKQNNKTTAEDIAERLGIEVPEGVTIGQFPPWMIEAASESLRETFEQEYWQKIDETTRDDLQRTLQTGIEDGLSMKKVAKLITEKHGSEYSRHRAMAVARTESGQMLNAGTLAAVEQTSQEVGIPIGVEWVSILGSTTRRSHADLDGQTRTQTGSFTLAGVKIPYPSHFSLPVGDRANCQCSIISVPVMEAITAEPRKPPEEAIADAEAMDKDLPIPKLSDLNFVEKLGDRAKKYQDKQGNFYVVKSGPEGFIAEDFTAEELYRALGVPVPDSQLDTDDGKLVKVSKWQEGTLLKDLPPDQKAAAVAAVRENFGADALLANWDVFGSSESIIVDKNGVPHRINTKASLRIGKDLTGEARELWTIASPNMTLETKLSSVQQALTKKDDFDKAMKKAVKNPLLSDKQKKSMESLKTIMDERFASVERYEKTARIMTDDELNPKYVDDFARHESGLHGAGVFDKMSKSLRHGSKGQETIMWDENNKQFDHLRGKDSTTVRTAKYMKAHGGDHAIVESYNVAQAKDSWSAKASLYKHFVMTEMRPGTADKHYTRTTEMKQAKKTWDKMTAKQQEKYRQTMIANHASQVAILKELDFPGNDREKGTIVLVRTESKGAMERSNMKPGDDKVMKRGAAESFSVVQEITVYGSETVYTEVPHHRIYGHYLTDSKTTGKGLGQGRFAGEEENEFIANTEGLKSFYKGKSRENRKVLTHAQLDAQRNKKKKKDLTL